ncbi:helix-turn-helix transcriptional regulator [Polaribacter batillariae]|uniref:Helix-turn-helix transcriptional regulator n=1 Tax=Polaribacter batillariae TaxID=2808900 RepID=A0ABX7SXG4_9FLAO|nr:helix-turn-helix transcriptional regulator [Polaribacter batillariae]QTD37950.1 helix-turn-helix transcriptional regulator [Polaribacter batillariae]
MRKIEFSNAVKKIRTEKGLSQEDLSGKSELSLRTIQRLENGKSEPRGDTLKRLTNALELPANYFNSILFENKSNKKSFKIPWFILGFLIIGGSAGFILSLILASTGIIPYNEFSLPFVIAIAIFFTGIGVITGNIIEKKYGK